MKSRLDADKHALYYSYIPVVPERPQLRRFDASGLKQIRQRLEANFCSQDEIDQITSDMMDDCVVVSQVSTDSSSSAKLILGGF